MKQSDFNSIQNRFRKFLSETKTPTVKKQRITEQAEPKKPLIESMEKTSVFGQDDSEIGYKVISTDSKGNQTYHIVPS